MLVLPEKYASLLWYASYFALAICKIFTKEADAYTQDTGHRTQDTGHPCTTTKAPKAMDDLKVSRDRPPFQPPFVVEGYV